MPLPTTCACCTHSQQAAIDQEIRDGARPQDLAGTYGLALRDISAHKRFHVLKESGRHTRPPRVPAKCPAELEKVRRR